MKNLIFLLMAGFILPVYAVAQTLLHENITAYCSKLVAPPTIWRQRIAVVRSMVRRRQRRIMLRRMRSL